MGDEKARERRTKNGEKRTGDEFEVCKQVEAPTHPFTCSPTHRLTHSAFLRISATSYVPS